MTTPMVAPSHALLIVGGMSSKMITVVLVRKVNCQLIDDAIYISLKHADIDHFEWRENVKDVHSLMFDRAVSEEECCLLSIASTLQCN